MEPQSIECDSFSGLLQAAKDHYRATGEPITMYDEPHRLRIGYAGTTKRWTLRLGQLKALTEEEQGIWGELLKTNEGRNRIARLIMTAGASEPPPRPALVVQTTPVMARIGEDALPHGCDEDDDSIDVPIDCDDQ